jgi:hypothetical protein
MEKKIMVRMQTYKYSAAMPSGPARALVTLLAR